LSFIKHLQALQNRHTYPLEELWEAFVHDCFDNFAIDISKPNTHHSSHNEKSCEQIYVACLFARPIWQHNLGQFRDASPKKTINIASTFLSAAL
jgi:hypothetical protein